MPGDDDAGVVHIGAFLDDELISACLIFPEVAPWLNSRIGWRLRSMASVPNRNGIGGGTAVLAEAVAIATAAGADVLWCHARESAIGFYRHAGWVAEGSVFDTEIGPHLRMWRPLHAGVSRSQTT
jgi:predicted GNAT family N-acyltransferase